MVIRLHGTVGSWTLPEGDTVMGRGEGCEIRVQDRRLSRRHVQFTVRGDLLVVADLGSANPVLVNGDRVAGRVGLAHGDALVVGPFLVRVEIRPGEAPRRLSNTAATQIPGEVPMPLGSPRGATQEMDPEVVAQLAHESRRAKAVDPHIAAALGRPPTRRMAMTDRLEATFHQPNAWDEGPVSGALASTPAAASLAPPLEAPQPTTAFTAPETAAPPTSALTPGPRPRPRFRPLVLRRLGAAILDAVGLLAVSLAVALVPLAAGLSWALVQTGAVIDQGRVLVQSGGSAAYLDILVALLTPTGMAALPSLIQSLVGQHHGFLGLYLGLSGAAIAAEVVLLLGAVAATVRHGAPLWHRQLGLELVVRRNGHRLGWVRALWRWTLWVVLAPVTALTIWSGKPSLHDRWSGSELRLRGH